MDLYTNPVAWFERAFAERTSESGRLCIVLAFRRLAPDEQGNLASDGTYWTEARALIKASLACDTAIADGKIAEGLAKVDKKNATGGKLDEAKRVSRGNVLPMRGG